MSITGLICYCCSLAFTHELTARKKQLQKIKIKTKILTVPGHHRPLKEAQYFPPGCMLSDGRCGKMTLLVACRRRTAMRFIVSMNLLVAEDRSYCIKSCCLTCIVNMSSYSLRILMPKGENKLGAGNYINFKQLSLVASAPKLASIHTQ